MLIELGALKRELPALEGRPVQDVCELLAGLGFPVDGVEERDGSCILEVDITANRGDAQSHRGMARDLAARLGAPLVPVDAAPLVEGEPLLPIRLEAGAAGPLYATAVLELGRPQGTPADVKAFLAAMGAGAKDLPAVDASNELLHRYGHPSHAFDADRIQGHLCVRWAREGETLVTLDGVERKLTPRDLLVADAAGPVALAGVMGGDGTKVTPETKRVLLESAWFDPRTVRAMAHRHGLHTDAGARFGRGADPAMARVARDLLAHRLVAWAGARLVGAWTVGEGPAPKAPIVLPAAMVTRVAGHPVDPEQAAGFLRALGCTVESLADGWRVIPPTWRHDLAIPEDLAEEVLRLVGYESIPAILPPLDSSPAPLDPGYLKRRKLAARLASLGFQQTVTLGFQDPKEAEDGHPMGDDPARRTLGNPLGEDYSLMRGTLLRSLDSVARLNLERGAREVRFFEIAPVFRATPAGLTETWTLGLVWGGEMGGEDPLTPPRKLGGPEGRSHLLGVLKALGVPEAALAGFDRWALTGWEAGSEVGLGWHVELPLSDLPDAGERVIAKFKPFSRFPVVQRDLSLLVGLDQAYAALHGALAAALADTPLLDLRCVDVFRHKSLPQGRQAWLVRLRFQAMDRTLTGEEVDGWVQAALAAARGLGAELRA
ncbi:phenylalanine--tRNA ligase subunit beta [Mesoterricola sediminis]|uniref:phenylalanine--tRNA ligase n=1 Tax=Mesoterricola sediminis TaxID=2927980 RepID=A0AA48GVT2_9BACT|nr:phenylalanine--tRNA ligase subunit beta [Mesoterricola sediminis]BDU78729.1 phenylalanine--tRNA ligase beta subunit [Mesoterricola sediminis]